MNTLPKKLNFTYSLNRNLIGFFMPVDAPATEYVYQISEADILRNNFKLFYKTFSGEKYIPEATFTSKDSVEYCLTGSPSFPFHNAAFGCPESEENFECSIDERIKFFKDSNVPFVWYLEENASDAFKQKLREKGFKDVGIFRGITGKLKKETPQIDLPEGCTLELVKDAATFEEFNELMCQIFEIKGGSKDLNRKVFYSLAMAANPTIYHWVAKKDGLVVSTLTTWINGNFVSFWNGATKPEFRRLGLSTALRRLALRHAHSKGCESGASYLQSDGMAYGICSKLGFETKWRFNVFLSPSN